MELKSFIKEVMFQLADGIKEVREKQNEHELIVNPSIVVGAMTCGRYVPNNLESYKTHERPVQFLHLNIELQTTENNELEVGGSTGLRLLGAKGGYKETATEMIGNRMSISIPICLPTTNIQEE